MRGASPERQSKPAAAISWTRFEAELLASPALDIVDRHVLSGPIYLLQNHTDAQEAFFTHIASGIRVGIDQIRVVGSAKAGFSLDPADFPRRLLPSSDVDVIVVDADRFDAVWTALLRWHAPRKFKKMDDWLVERIEDIYWGRMDPSRIRPDPSIAFVERLTTLRDISENWVSTFNSLSNYPQFPHFSNRTCRGRLYRTWDHARIYHEHSLFRLKRKREQRNH